MVNALDMQVVVSTVPPTLVEEKKDELIRSNIQKRLICVFINKLFLCLEMTSGTFVYLNKKVILFKVAAVFHLKYFFMFCVIHLCQTVVERKLCIIVKDETRLGIAFQPLIVH